MRGFSIPFVKHQDVSGDEKKRGGNRINKLGLRRERQQILYTPLTHNIHDVNYVGVKPPLGIYDLEWEADEYE